MIPEVLRCRCLQTECQASQAAVSSNNVFLGLKVAAQSIGSLLKINVNSQPTIELAMHPMIVSCVPDSWGIDTTFIAMLEDQISLFGQLIKYMV